MRTKIKLSKCTFMAVCVILLFGIASCKKTEVPLYQNTESSSDLLLNKSASQFSPEVIDKWITMQLRLDRDAVGISNVAFFRYTAYSGVAAFAAVAPGTNVGTSFSGKLNRLTNLPQANALSLLYWPASVNTALAFMNRSMFTTATVADKAAIDSLENALNNSFLAKINLQSSGH